MSHVSVPVTIDLPYGYRRVAWPGRLGTVAAVVGEPEHPRGSALLIHGFTGSKEDYFAILGPLYERGWAVAAADLPGTTESDGPAGRQFYGLADLAGDVVRMLQQCSGSRPVHLVGHSVGGLVVREAALDATAEIASLTLYGSGPAAVGEQARADAAMLTAALQSHSPGEVQRLKEALDAAAGRPAPPPPIAAFLRRRWEQTSPGHLLGMAEIAVAPPDRVDALAAAVAADHLAAMVLRGAADEVWPTEQFEALAETIDARSVVIADAGHSPASESPLAMAEALDAFWRES